MPFKMTFDMMEDAIILTHDSVASGRWKVNEGKAYLATQGFNEKAQTQVLFHAEMDFLYRQAEELKDVSDVMNRAFQDIKKEKEMKPEVFERFKSLAIWSGVPLMHHMDCIMHLLFEGIVKTTIKLIFRWASAKRVGKHLKESLCDGRFGGIRALRLAGYKVEQPR